MNPTDADLMRLWQGGDAGAFTVLVRRWEQRLARFLTHLVGSPELVQDLCQEVFLRLYQAGARYRENGTFSTWVYRIALNVARDAGRRKRRQPAPLAEGEVAAAAPGPEALCARDEECRLVGRAVAELPEPFRLVLILRHYENLSFEAIARLTDTPASTLKSRFAVALNRLRVRLNRLGCAHEGTEP